MRLHTIAKLGGFLSIILFLIGVGMYGFAKLSEAGNGKNIDLLSLVPCNSTQVLETDNLDYFSNEFPQASYARHLNEFSQTGVVDSILKNIVSFSSVGAHRLGNQMNHLLISFHSLGNVDGVVVYFKMTKEAKKLLADIFMKQEKSFSPKVEKYRDEDITIFPYQQTRFVSVYSGKGFLAASFQKRLIEQVIDAEKDNTSLRQDPNFSRVYHTKSANHMTLYGKMPVVPFDCPNKTECWNEFDIHLNSDVFYLSGNMYAGADCLRHIDEGLRGIEMKSDSNFLMVSGQNQVDSCISEAIVSPHNSLFDECVSTLSREASYILVADLAEAAVEGSPYKSYLPSFITSNLDKFGAFILSVQVTKLKDHYSHILVFTYKN